MPQLHPLKCQLGCKGPRKLQQKQLNFHDVVYGGQKKHGEALNQFLLKLGKNGFPNLHTEITQGEEIA